MSPERVSVDELLVRIERLHRGRSPSALAFDADGTLWSGDVAEDVFHWALGREMLSSVPARQLAEVARTHGIDHEGTSNELATAMFEAYVGGSFPERTVCEVMAWCFAGHATDELRSIARQALDDAGLAERVNLTLAPVFEWAEREKVRVVIVTASPRFIVEEAARHWNIGPRDIAATTPAFDSGRMLPRLVAPVPYGQAKVVFARGLFGDAAWLASFGDSPFDLEMLGAAELGVAVRPKPALVEALPALRRSVILEG